MHDKVRLTASVDPEQLAAAREAVAAGRADSVSAWVNEAMRRQAALESRLAAMAALIAAHEAEHGVITDDEMLDASRWARERAVVVRGNPDL
jgi:Arc/MetJ-type ribon-helix-helix transcriptional regulator